MSGEPRPAHRFSRQRRFLLHEAHRRRLLGVVPVRGIGLFELPRRGRRLPAAPRHGQRRPGRAAAPLRSLRPRRDLPQPSAPRPLHRHARVLRRALLPARRRPVRARAGLLPRGHRAPADHGLRRHPLRLLDERGVRLPHRQAVHVRDRPLHGAHRPGPPPRGGVRGPAGARRPDPRLLRGHRRHPRAGRTGPGRRPVPVRGRVHVRQGEHPRPPSQRPRGGRDGHPCRRAPYGPDPHRPVDRPRSQPPRRARGLRGTGRTGGAGRGLRDLTRRRARRPRNPSRGSGAFVVPVGRLTPW
ncbi:Metal-dependent hydrolases of the beta-lactamase superfamily III [Streptomyces misionensis JCM 4497]